MPSIKKLSSNFAVRGIGRIKTKKSDKGLLTPEEIQAKKAGIEASEVGTSPEIPRAQDQDEDIFSISFDEKEVSEARDRVASEIQDKKEEVKKEIGVTKILSLTPEELESLKKGDS